MICDTPILRSFYDFKLMNASPVSCCLSIICEILTACVPSYHANTSFQFNALAVPSVYLFSRLPTLSLLQVTYRNFQLEEASTHKSAYDSLRQWFCDSQTWPFEPKIIGFPGLILGHFYVKFGDSSSPSVFWDIVRKNIQTHRQTEFKKTLPPRLYSAWIISITLSQKLINFRS